MSRFNFDNITLEDSADITKVMGNFNKIEENWELYEVPTGSIIGYDGNTVPEGYEEYEPNGKILKAYTLFTGSTTGNVVLSDNASNYDYIEIFYSMSSLFKGSVKCLKNSGTVSLSGISYASSRYLQPFVEKVTISDSVITRGTLVGVNIDLQTLNMGDWSGTLTISKVVGYKEV